MQVLAADFAERARCSPEEPAVIDASGEHSTAELQRAAQALAGELGEALTGAPTVLVQADNTWRTLAAALAIGQRGGVMVVISRHATRSEFELACADVLPDAVVASDDVLSGWQASGPAFPAHSAVLDGW